MRTHSTLALFLVGVVPALSEAAPLILDSGNRVIGYYLGKDYGNGQCDCPDAETGVTERGFRFSFVRRTGRVVQPPGGPGYTTGQGTIRFTSTDCTGQAYMEVNSSSPYTPGAVFIGTVPHNPGGGVPPASTPERYYVLPEALPPEQQVTVRSYWHYTHPQNQLLCAPDNIIRTVIPVEENNPATTGLPNPPLLGPLRITTSMLFRDGFEGLL